VSSKLGATSAHTNTKTGLFWQRQLQLYRIVHAFIVVVFFRPNFKQFFLVVIHFYAPSLFFTAWGVIVTG